MHKKQCTTPPFIRCSITTHVTMDIRLQFTMQVFPMLWYCYCYINHRRQALSVSDVKYVSWDCHLWNFHSVNHSEQEKMQKTQITEIATIASYITQNLMKFNLNFSILSFCRSRMAILCTKSILMLGWICYCSFHKNLFCFETAW